MSINRMGRLQPDAARRSAPLRAPTPYSCPATNTRMRELTPRRNHEQPMRFAPTMVASTGCSTCSTSSPTNLWRSVSPARMQLSFLFNREDVALPALRLDPDTELARVVPVDVEVHQQAVLHDVKCSCDDRF